MNFGCFFKRCIYQTSSGSIRKQEMNPKTKKQKVWDINSNPKKSKD